MPCKNNYDIVKKGPENKFYTSDLIFTLKIITAEQSNELQSPLYMNLIAFVKAFLPQLSLISQSNWLICRFR